MTTVTELLEPVEADLEILLSDLRSLIGAGHPILQAAGRASVQCWWQTSASWNRSADLKSIGQ